MIQLDIRHGEACLSDLPRDEFVGGVPGQNGQPMCLGEITHVGVLPNATTDGRPCVAVVCKLPDGSLAVGETSARNFVLAAHAIEGWYPDLFQGD